jgi:hypothetical protein
MDFLQFSLFFAALLVGYLLIHLRMVRFEQYMKEMAGIRTLNQRLDSLVEALGRVRLDRTEQLLQQLHEDLRAVQRATSAVEETLVRQPSPIHSAAVLAPASGAGRVQAVVETRLFQLGYSDLRLLTDLGTLPPEGDVEILVECERSGMPCKGRVTVRNGSIRDVQIQSAAQTFP